MLRVVLRGSWQGGKSSLNIKILGGYPADVRTDIRAGRPGPKTFTPLLGAQEDKVFCADVLDPKARTSMTRGGSQRHFMQENFGLIFRFLSFGDQTSMGMAMFKRKFARRLPDNLRASHMKMWGFETRRARKFTRTSPRTLPWNLITMLSAPPNLGGNFVTRLTFIGLGSLKLSVLTMPRTQHRSSRPFQGPGHTLGRV